MFIRKITGSIKSLLKKKAKKTNRTPQAVSKTTDEEPIPISPEYPIVEAPVVPQTSSIVIKQALKQVDNQKIKSVNNIEPQHVYINNQIIFQPKENDIYHIQDKASSKEMIIIFTGNLLADVTQFDCSTFQYQYPVRFHHQGDIFIRTENLFSESHDIYILNSSLPIDMQSQFPPFLFHNTKKPNCLFQMTEVKIQLNRNNRNCYHVRGLPFSGIKICNEELIQQYQLIAGDISVRDNIYPIFASKNQPTRKALKDIYAKFIQYNDNTKLAYQCEDDTWCTARAHFLSVLLNNYGITTIKLFKDWGFKTRWQNEWRWLFHCVTATIDSKNRIWIWDPWEGFNQDLMTLNEWLRRKDEPLPAELIISNSSVLSDLYDGSSGIARSTNIKSTSNNFFQAFQKACTSALPNPPEHPLSRPKDKHRLCY